MEKTDSKILVGSWREAGGRLVGPKHTRVHQLPPGSTRNFGITIFIFLSAARNQCKRDCLDTVQLSKGYKTVDGTIYDQVLPKKNKKNNSPKSLVDPGGSLVGGWWEAGGSDSDEIWIEPKQADLETRLDHIRSPGCVTVNNQPQTMGESDRLWSRSITPLECFLCKSIDYHREEEEYLE